MGGGSQVSGEPRGAPVCDHGGGRGIKGGGPWGNDVNG